jgi:hypothetical protein
MSNGRKDFVVAGLIIAAGVLAGCGGGGSSEVRADASLSTAAAGRGAGIRSGSIVAVSPVAGTSSAGATNKAPSISGAAAPSVVAGQPYTFQPKVSDSEGDTLSFTIANKPAWATFNPATGRLSGTPGQADVGTYAQVQISTTDGTSHTALPAFSIAVTAIGQHSLTLTWTAPDENVDGSPLVDLSGYKIHYGTQSSNYTQTVTLSNAGLSEYVVENLGAGAYYFVITAYNSAGVESPLSGEVSTTL